MKKMQPDELSHGLGNEKKKKNPKKTLKIPTILG